MPQADDSAFTVEGYNAPSDLPEQVNNLIKMKAFHSMEECVKKTVVAAYFTAAIALTACGAQPANLPTVTPLKPAVVLTPDAAVKPDGDRPFAKLSAENRSKISTTAPAISIDVNKKYMATIMTAKGEIKVELDPSAAPQTVNNFVYLSQNGFYDGLVFHRVEPNFVIQGGDPLGNGSGGPGYTLPPEIKLTHIDGAIAMARQGGDAATTPSSGSQFYITIGAQSGLDGQYTVFGRTISGLDIVRKIAVGDVIERIDVVATDQVSPTPAPIAVGCEAYPLNLTANDHARGSATASVVILEYSDMQCPACGQVAPGIKNLYEQMSDTVRIVFRHFPLTTIHDKAQITAQAIEAAGRQDKFWQLHDLLYEKQAEWSQIPVTDIVSTLKGYAQGLGMDLAKFESDLNSAEVKERIQTDVSTAEKLQLSGTPTMFLSGRPMNPSAMLQENIISLMREYVVSRTATVTGSKASSVNVSKPDQVIDGDTPYQLTLKTSKGDIEIQLDPKLAPVNVNSTIFLAQKGYYDGTPVDQAVRDIGLVLFGDASLLQNPGYTCGLETPATGSFSKAGVVALLNLGQGNFPQLIITYSPTQQLESQFTVIGEVTSGLEVVKTLQESVAGTQADKIISATVLKK